jgi:hypothetical protein
MSKKIDRKKQPCPQYTSFIEKVTKQLCLFKLSLFNVLLFNVLLFKLSLFKLSLFNFLLFNVLLFNTLDISLKRREVEVEVFTPMGSIF